MTSVSSASQLAQCYFAEQQQEQRTRKLADELMPQAPADHVLATLNHVIVSSALRTEPR